MREHSSKKIELMVVGKKGRDTFRKRGLSFVGEYLDVSAKVEFAKAKEIAARIAEIYTNGEVDAVYAIYNEFKNVMVQNLQAAEIASRRSRCGGGRERRRRVARKPCRAREFASHGVDARRQRAPGGLHLRAAR